MVPLGSAMTFFECSSNVCVLRFLCVVWENELPCWNLKNGEFRSSVFL